MKKGLWAHDPVAIPVILSSLIEDAQISNGKRMHNITLTCDKTLWLRGSDKELSSAFSNLIFNAVQYTPDHGHIEIHWHQKNKNIIFAVKDDGIGIANQHLQRLTERFYRVDAGRSREYGGTGLGLAIVKRILDRHSAHLEIESQPGMGSTFRCIFPARLAFAHKTP